MSTWNVGLLSLPSKDVRRLSVPPAAQVLTNKCPTFSGSYLGDWIDDLNACTSIPRVSDFRSFAAITDEPPEEIVASGHDRCIVPIKPKNVGA
jgi:hypothetical protein